MNIILIQPADKELHEAIDYYNDQLAGLGEQFYTSFLDTYPKLLILGEKLDLIREELILKDFRI